MPNELKAAIERLLETWRKCGSSYLDRELVKLEEVYIGVKDRL